MAHFIYIFVIIFCSVHARAQYREIEEDRVDALQGVEKTLAVKTAERVAANGGAGAVPPFVPNDTYVIVQITDDPAYAYVSLQTFHQLSRNKTFRVWNKKILGANYTEEGSGLASNGQGKIDAVRANATTGASGNGNFSNNNGAATNGAGDAGGVGSTTTNSYERIRETMKGVLFYQYRYLFWPINRARTNQRNLYMDPAPRIRPFLVVSDPQHQ